MSSSEMFTSQRACGAGYGGALTNLTSYETTLHDKHAHTMLLLAHPCGVFS